MAYEHTVHNSGHYPSSMVRHWIPSPPLQSPEDGDRFQSPKRRVLNRNTRQWIMPRVVTVI
jgi:hypothetical protein